MPKGHSQLEADVKLLRGAIDALVSRVADLERRLIQANEYFAKGYIPPAV